VQLRPRADVRRKRSNPVEELLRRPAPVELAVSRTDLLRVRHALFALKPERRRGENLVQELDAELGGARRDRAEVVFDADREGALGRDRACVELGHEPDDRDSRLRIARHQSPFDRSGAAPARQQ